MLIEGASVVTVDQRNRILEPGWIAVRDGQITALSRRPIPPLDGEERLDATGKVVLPGLVNAHTHLFQTLIRGIFDRLPFTRWLRGIYHCHGALSADACRAAGALGSLESLRSGVTTVADHQFLNSGVDWALGTIAGIREVGLRAVVARTIMDLGELAPAAALESPQAGLRSVRDLVEACGGPGGPGGDRMLTVMTGANTPGVSASGELAVAVREFAEQLGIGRSEHIAESADVLAAVEARSGRHGVVEWLDGIDALGEGLLAPHAVHVSPSEIDLMALRRVSVSHNPVSNMFLGDGIAPVPELLRAGVNVALGTDGASSNNAQDMFEVMKAAALLQRLRTGGAAAVDPEAVLRMATINGARALGLDDVTGSIERGKRADLVVLDLDQPQTTGVHDLLSAIVYCASPANVESVMVDGRMLLRQGEMVATVEARVLAEAREAAHELASRLEALGVRRPGTALPAATADR